RRFYERRWHDVSDGFPPRPTPRPAALRPCKARSQDGAKASPRPTTAEDTAANSRRKAGEALGLAAFLSPSLAAMITHAPHRLARKQGGGLGGGGAYFAALA